MSQDNKHLILSARENTPEFQRALSLHRNRGRGSDEFYTTWGHVVTKILDMNITFTLADGSTIRPFTTVGEVRTFFRIENDDMGDEPKNRFLFHRLYELYREKVEGPNKNSLKPMVEWVTEFFQDNVWRAVSDDDSLDILFQAILELENMGIEGISRDKCIECIEQILYYSVESGCSWNMWQEKEVDEKKDYVVGNVNKQEITDFFVDAVVVYPDRKNGVFRQVERVERAIRNLVQVDPSSQEFDGLTDVVGSKSGTRYL